MSKTELEARAEQHPQVLQQPAPVCEPKGGDANKPRNEGGAKEAKPAGAQAQSTGAPWFDQGLVDGSGQRDQARDAAGTDQDSKLARSPIPFNLPSQLDFTGVVGHTTSPQTFEIINKEVNPNEVKLKIIGNDMAAFSIDAAESMLIPSSVTGKSPNVGVRFTPTRPGALDAVLLINHDNGQQHVNLRGNAMQGDGQASKPDGATPGVSSLPDLDQSDPKAAASHLQEAGRHVAETVERFRVVEPRARAALAALKANASNAATTLQSRTIKWLTDEGISTSQTVEEPDRAAEGAEIGQEALEKVFERGEEAAPGLAIPIKVGQWVIGKVIGFATSNREETKAEEKADDDLGHAQLAAKHAHRADSTLNGIVDQLSSVGENLAFYLGNNDEVTREVPQALQMIQEGISSAGDAGNATQAYSNAERVVNAYVRNEGLMWQALANVELFATSIVQKTDAAFNNLLDEYALERHKQAAAYHRDGRRLAVRVLGTFDLDQEPPIQLQHLDIEGLAEASVTMKEHFGNKRLTELPLGCDVKFDLTSSQYGTVHYEWSPGMQMLYHDMPPSDGPWPRFMKHDGIERIKSALMDTKIGEGTS